MVQCSSWKLEIDPVCPLLQYSPLLLPLNISPVYLTVCMWVSVCMCVSGTVFVCLCASGGRERIKEDHDLIESGSSSHCPDISTGMIFCDFVKAALITYTFSLTSLI